MSSNSGPVVDNIFRRIRAMLILLDLFTLITSLVKCPTGFMWGKEADIGTMFVLKNE